MQKRNYLPLLLGAAILTFLPARTGMVLAQGAICGQFTDVPSSSVYCPFIVEAFYTSITQGTSATTFNPSDSVPREQAVTFFTRTMDTTLHRGTVRTATGKTWSPTSALGGAVDDIGTSINDIVSDGTNLWVAKSDGKVLKMGAADRKLLETWTVPGGAVARRLGLFAGLVWISDSQGGLSNFNPAGAATTATLVTNSAGIVGNFPTLAFDGTNIWWAASGSSKIWISQVGNANGLSFNPGFGVVGMVFDGTNMWVLLGDSRLLKMSIPSAGAALPSTMETVTLPGPAVDCRMVFDGNNIWIPIGTPPERLYVVHPSASNSPSLIVKTDSNPEVSSPFVASFDGEYVMIGGANNGVVALYKATNLQRIRTFNTGALGIRSIANDGRYFTVGDSVGTKIFQF